MSTAIPASSSNANLGFGQDSGNIVLTHFGPRRVKLVLKMADHIRSSSICGQCAAKEL
jgi:hypothetical protein